MMKLDSLKKLYIEELRDLYSAENQLVKALPKMAKAASAPKLQQAFQTHLRRDQESGHAAGNDLREAREIAQREDVQGDAGTHRGR